MAAVPTLRRAGPDSRLALCVTAALVLHAALLLSPGGRVGAVYGLGGAMTVRSIQLQLPESTIQALAAPEALPALNPSGIEPLQLKVLAPPPAVTSTSHSDSATAPQLIYPDASLPGAQALATVALSVESDGYVSALSIEPNKLPSAFERAVQHAFEGSMLSPEQRGGGIGSGHLCIEVSFREGEAPSWQRISPSGICIA